MAKVTVLGSGSGLGLEREGGAGVRVVEQTLEHVAAELHLPLGFVLDDVGKALLQQRGVAA